MDFEFIQKVKDQKRTFVMKIYNKEMTVKDVTDMLTFECTNAEQFFVMTHLVERQLPAKWQGFFEKAL